MRALGLLLQDNGKHAQAEPLVVRELNATRVVLGERHLDTFAAMNNLGLLLQVCNLYVHRNKRTQP